MSAKKMPAAQDSSSAEDAIADDHLDEVVLARNVRVTKKRIRPTRADEGFYEGDEEEDDFQKAAPAPKRKKKSAQDAAKKGGSSLLYKELLERLAESFQQKSDKELLNGGIVEWTFHQEAKVIITPGPKVAATLQAARN